MVKLMIYSTNNVFLSIYNFSTWLMSQCSTLKLDSWAKLLNISTLFCQKFIKFQLTKLYSKTSREFIRFLFAFFFLSACWKGSLFYELVCSLVIFVSFFSNLNIYDMFEFLKFFIKINKQTYIVHTHMTLGRWARTKFFFSVLIHVFVKVYLIETEVFEFFYVPSCLAVC